MVGLSYVFVYIDDILIASPDTASHLRHLEEVLRRLIKAGLLINLEKCSFLQSCILASTQVII